MRGVFAAAYAQLRMRGLWRIAALSGVAALPALAAAERAIVLPFAQEAVMELGPLTCFLWVPFFRAVAAPRAWTLEWGYRRLILARFVALIWASGCAVAIAILVAATDSTITSGMAARNTLMIASLIIALSRSIGPDPATLVPMGIFGLLLLAGKHNDNTVAGWAVVLHPDLSIPAIIVLLAFLLAATAAECAPPSQPKDE